MATAESVVKREFKSVGSLRVRVVTGSARPNAPAVLDIREYLVGDGFEGFTRRGIRIKNADEARTLIEALQACIDEDMI